MNLRYFKLTFFALFFLTGILSAAKPAQKEKGFFSMFFKDSSAFLYCYTTDDGSDGLHLLYSHDGIIWRSINKDESLLKPAVGKSIQDPSIVQDANGTFHMVFTTGSKNSLGYASSKDLITWSEQKELPVMADEKEVLNSSAPELHYDKLSRTFQILWASTIPGRFETEKTEDGFNNRLYSTTTTDFSTFTKTKLLFDPEFSVSDGCILKSKGSFYLYFKNDLDRKIQYATSGKIRSFPTKVSEPISGKKFAKGPSAMQVGEYTYVYWENDVDKRVSAVRCKNIKKAVWEDVTDMIRFPGNVKQGSAFIVDNETLIQLQNLEKGIE